MKYTFSGLTASFNAHGLPITYTFSGEVCGDPSSTPWSISFSVNGSPPFTRPVSLPVGTPVDVAAYAAKDAGGVDVARATLRLTFTTGPPPQMELSVAQTGDVSNLQIGAAAAVAATPVAACP